MFGERLSKQLSADLIPNTYVVSLRKIMKLFFLDHRFTSTCLTLQVPTAKGPSFFSFLSTSVDIWHEPETS